MSGKIYFVITDFGSSYIKTSLIDIKGKLRFFNNKDFFPIYEGNKVEYDPLKFLDIYKSTLKDVFNYISKGDTVFYGITSQRSSFVIWDRYTGKPLSPIISWQDRRAEELSKRFDFLSNNEIHNITGLYKTPYYSAFKIKYLLHSNKELQKKISNKKVILGPIASYALWHISEGKLFICDPTLAQRMFLFNIKTLNWDEKLLDFFNLPLSCLPDIIDSFPLNLQLKIFGYDFFLSAFIGDQQAAVLPFIKENKAVINYGTGAFLLAGTGDKILKVKGLLNSIAFTKDKYANYLVESTVNSCGTFLKWLSIVFNSDIKIKEIDSLVKASKNRILVLPSIGGIGSPYWDYNTLTTFTGFNSSSSFNDILRGALEGIAFLISEGFKRIEDKLDIDSIVVSGGLSNIDYLCSFQSDILGKKLIKLKNTEMTSLGLVSMIGSLNGYKFLDKNIFEVDKVYQPKISLKERQKLLKDWKNFFVAIKSLYRKIDFTL